MIICYSGKSKPGALKLADALVSLGHEVVLARRGRGDVNWGRAGADTLLNSAIGRSTNKRIMRETFAEHDVPMPKLYTAEEVRVALVEAPGKVFVGRPDSHTRGKGYWLVGSLRSLERAIRGTRRKKAATHFMEYIQADAEYRAHIFMGKSIRLTEKQFDENHKYTTIKPGCSKELRRKLRRAAKEAVSALGLDFGAVDILAAGDDVFVLEVNTSPGLGGSTPRVYAEAINNWYEEDV